MSEGQDDRKPPPLMPRAQRRFLEAFERIRLNQPAFDDLAYMARELVQVTLPHRNPGDMPAWSRSNGNLTMTVRPGWDHQKHKMLGYPYGSIPRLLLFWLTAEAVRTRCRIIELGHSLSDFMFQLGLNPATGRGPRGDAQRLREQMQRLFRATISLDRATTQGVRASNVWLDMQIAPHGEFWWSVRDPSQAALWGSWIELGEKFFDAITAAPVPLDMRVLKALKRSPLALDLYAWLSYEAFRAHKSGKGRFVAWRLLAGQMGGDYANTDEFARKGRITLRKIQVLYPALRLGPVRGGVRIEPDSLPAITPRSTTTINF
jgi:Plasmid encoded RepA protein